MILLEKLIFESECKNKLFNLLYRHQALQSDIFLRKPIDFEERDAYVTDIYYPTIFIRFKDLERIATFLKNPTCVKVIKEIKAFFSCEPVIKLNRDDDTNFFNDLYKKNNCIILTGLTGAGKSSLVIKNIDEPQGGVLLVSNVTSFLCNFCDKNDRFYFYKDKFDENKKT